MPHPSRNPNPWLCRIVVSPFLPASDGSNVPEIHDEYKGLTGRPNLDDEIEIYSVRVAGPVLARVTRVDEGNGGLPLVECEQVRPRPNA